ncbi:2-amino-4-hydroxy-6-hydroxymethyldihydropteridine diphosphokinase [Polymorphobacter fuscus]|uniref:2-amino-4-hydroxy-6-hydroxymethyldihydropteridine pyrophosphokinase n=1 Tax=Sandarakinorhabdus fusca TaxID=1439888 RepID=A0A7C9GMM5_9SPHN|nr:2-amino-4-hydroxy-6-hydroxymethyldihydropteridine diphosphokinase [Polymorphobacter fuscus]KAB7648585.1 2-amino-4-hydroxy-6-hydroxymethyldihydropteridine diphosphokinase [Polymorphobacter fuscus]MQT16132.1 2-amino-4-hydroxy-6-hydroxymethyldihydropteridine diphosphokinase [Polymorphobacter fuscus]NJC07589.1 2-amino-4-hydroxy-6-hydroxymethyldihydropteridine diphosphokinase [Polymorphobacter fuscus]
METTILIALGSNRRHGRHGRPEAVVLAAMRAMTAHGLAVTAQSRIHATAPLGPGGRRFANAAVAVSSSLPPGAVLGIIKAIERDFGRRGGKRWGDRVLDLDIIAAGDAVVASGALQVPHPRMADRRFVLDPLVEIAPDWRHPLRHATVRQLRARAMRPKGRVHVAKRVGP